MASFKVSGFRVLRRLIEHKTIERLSAGIPSQIGKSGWGFTSTRLGGLAWGLVKIDNISRFGNINQPYKRVFIGRIKSIIKTIYQSINITYFIYSMRSENNTSFEKTSAWF